MHSLQKVSTNKNIEADYLTGLSDLALKTLKEKVQAITFGSDGKIISSDEGLVSILKFETNIFSEPIFFGLNETVLELEGEEEILLKCVEAAFFERESIYDFVIKRIESNAQHQLFALIVHDLRDQYQIAVELRQERNNAEIQSQELIKAHLELNEVLQKEVNGRKMLQEAQTRLVQSEKMVSLGHLTSGMGHEINNPLNFIENGSLLLRKKLNAIANLDSEEAKSKAIEALDYLDAVEVGSNRIKSVIKGLQLFNGKNNDEFILADLHANLDATVSLISLDGLSPIEIKKDYSNENFVLNCIPGKLNQAFMNILKNAIQSISKGNEGIIILSTLRNEDKVEISIKDNGEGIPLNNIRKIFDPFFTTRTVGNGVGLGLSISHTIVQEHKGDISFESKPNVGSEFIIRLPIN